MTNEQIEQAVREVVEQDASPRKVQALMRAVEKYGIEWLKNYQQRQQRQPATRRQYTSRQRITLDWADVKAWVKRQEHTSENWAVGGYYTDCPVSTHKTDDLISIWEGKDGGLGLKCWGSCTYNDIHEALADAIKTGTPSVTEPQAAADARIKELEAALVATKDQHAQEQANFEEHLADIKARHARELESRSSAVRGATIQARRKGREEERARNEGHIKKLEQELIDTKAERERERAARIAAETNAQEPQAGNSSLAKNLAALKAELERESAAREELAAEKADLTKQLTATKAELAPTRAARIAAENYARTLQTENSSLKDRLAAASNVRQDVRAPNTLQVNGPLAGAWGLFRKDEPTYAFIDAMSVLELNLRRALERKTVLADDGLQHMLMAACEQHIALISEEQRRRLDEMRRNRNRVLHHRHQLEISEARDALDYLKSTIGHLAPSRSSIRALGGVIG